MAARKTATPSVPQTAHDAVRRLTEHAPAAPIEIGTEPPFRTGDLVELKSGGFPMTVEQIDGRCGSDRWTVHVMFATDQARFEISRDSLPASCLRLAELASDGRAVRRIHIDDDLPF